VFPVSRLKKEPLLKDDILETQMLFLLRNTFEIRGYRYVEVTEKPDILATIDGYIQYRKGLSHPETMVSPKWLSEKRALDNYVPGSMSKQIYKVPGQTAGTCYPVVRIDALDPETLKPIWAGIGMGTAGNSDLRVSGQTIAIFLLGEFPEGPISRERIMTPFGFDFFVFTNNGNDYYPTVFQVINDSPAGRAGVMQYDMIESVDGLSLKNRPLSEIIKIFRKGPGSKRSFTLLRGDKRIGVCVSPRFR